MDQSLTARDAALRILDAVQVQPSLRVPLDDALGHILAADVTSPLDIPAHTNSAMDGTYRKIKVELVNPATNEPLSVKDEKGKPVKYSIVTKSGYKAPRPVE